MEIFKLGDFEVTLEQYFTVRFSHGDLAFNCLLSRCFNCLKPKKTLIRGKRNIFRLKKERDGFFYKMIKKYIKNYLLKKKHPKRTSANQM